MPLSEKAARSKDLSTGTYAAPQLQHRHFAFIAACIAGMSFKVARFEACRAFTTRLFRTNSSFDSSRFREACKCEANEYTLQELDLAITTTTYWLEHLQNERLGRGIEQAEAAE